MNRLMTSAAVAVLLGLTPALAADTSAPPADDSASQSAPQPQASEESSGNLPTQPGVSPEVAKEATEPESGSADTSGGAMERSSAPPESSAAEGGKAPNGDITSADPSGAAKERSSAPEGSSAANPSQPNPTIGAEDDKDASEMKKSEAESPSPSSDAETSSE